MPPWNCIIYNKTLYFNQHDKYYTFLSKIKGFRITRAGGPLVSKAMIGRLLAAFQRYDFRSFTFTDTVVCILLQPIGVVVLPIDGAGFLASLFL